MNERTFRPIANPYIVGNPVEDGRMFFGREDDFAYIRQKFTGGAQSGMIVLCGTRRSGKTSILFQIKRGRLGRDYVPVLVDMQSMSAHSDEDFLSRLAEEILVATGIGEGASAQSRLQPAPYRASDFRELLRAVRARLGDRKLVLMFDEYELFETAIDQGHFTPAVLDYLGACLDEGFFVLFTGSDKLEARNAIYWAQVLGRSLHRRISFLSLADARRLVEEPLRGIIRFAEGVTSTVCELTAGQPFYTQFLCQSLVDHLNEVARYDVTMEDLETVVQETIENPLPHMIFTWSSLTDIEKVVLSVSAELSRDGDRPVEAADILRYLEIERIGVTLDPNLLHEALERLFIQDLLNKDEGGDHYTFKMGLWRRWLSRMHSIWQVLDEIRREDGRYGEGILTAHSRRRRALLLLLVPVAAMALLGLRALLWPEPPAPRSPPAVLAPADSTWLSVTTVPEGADVYLASRLLGRSPLVRLRVAAVAAPLRISLNGYVDHADTLSLARDLPETLHVTLAGRTGDLDVRSDPPGARIVLDGRSTGETTPHLFLGLSVNAPHAIRMSLAAYQDGTYTGLRIPADSTRLIHHVFRPITHPLTIVSEPTGADVVLDGRVLGPTPRSLAAVGQGAHRLLLRHEGYHPLEQSITVPAPDNMFRVTLVALPPGTLVIRAQPYADVYIDGELKESGTVFYNQELPQGRYTVLLRHPHLGDYEQQVEVRSGETTTCDHDFERGSR
jgi:hypothetical protein